MARTQSLDCGWLRMEGVLKTFWKHHKSIPGIFLKRNYTPVFLSQLFFHRKNIFQKIKKIKNWKNIFRENRKFYDHFKWKSLRDFPPNILIFPTIFEHFRGKSFFSPFFSRKYFLSMKKKLRKKNWSIVSL